MSLLIGESVFVAVEIGQNEVGRGLSHHWMRGSSCMKSNGCDRLIRIVASDAKEGVECPAWPFQIELELAATGYLQRRGGACLHFGVLYAECVDLKRVPGSIADPQRETVSIGIEKNF